MQKLISNSVVIVWAILVAATLFSWILGGIVKTESFSSGSIAILVLAISFFKTRLVLIHFMELGDAPWKLRLAFEIWVLISCAVLIAMYFVPIVQHLSWF